MPRCADCLGTGQVYLTWDGSRHPWEFCACLAGQRHWDRNSGKDDLDFRFADHEQVQCTLGNRAAWVDKDMLGDIRLLWENGIGTRYSCRGDYWPEWGSTRYVALESADDFARSAGLLPWVRWASTDGMALYESGTEEGSLMRVMLHA